MYIAHNIIYAKKNIGLKWLCTLLWEKQNDVDLLL